MTRPALSRFAAGFLAIYVLAAPACSAPETVDETSLAIAALDARIPTLLEEADVHGFTIAVAKRGELLWSEAYGMASTELDRLAITETIFEAASLGWRADGSERAIIVFDRPIASFSLVSTAEDLAHLTAYYFQQGGLNEALYAESIRPLNPAPPDAWGHHIPAGANISWTLAWAAQEIR